MGRKPIPYKKTILQRTPNEILRTGMKLLTVEHLMHNMNTYHYLTETNREGIGMDNVDNLYYFIILLFYKCHVATNYPYTSSYNFNHIKLTSSDSHLIHIFAYLFLTVRLRNINMTKDIPGFPAWSLPLTMNCTCSEPCSYVSYSSQAYVQESYSVRMLKPRYIVLSLFRIINHI